MFINTLSVGNIATEKQLLSVSSLWPRLTSTHNQYEKKKEPCSQIYKIRTSNKSTIWTSLFQKKWPYQVLPRHMPHHEKEDGLQAHVFYSKCFNSSLSICRISSQTTQRQEHSGLCENKMKVKISLCSSKWSRILNHFLESSWSLKENQYALRGSNLVGCQMLARVLKLRVL